MHAFREAPLAYVLLGYIAVAAMGLAFMIQAGPATSPHEAAWRPESVDNLMAPHDAVAISEGPIGRLVH